MAERGGSGKWWRSPYATAVQFAILVLLVGWTIGHGVAGMNYHWQWSRVPKFLFTNADGEFVLGRLPQGLLVTLGVTFWSLLLSLLIGLATALVRLSRSLVGRALARVYLEVIRNTPLLVQLYLFYFVIAPIFNLNRYLVGIVTLGLFEGAYVSEIIRAGILAVHQGQWEASRALGLSEAQTYRSIILPQAVRVILPPLASQTISLVKSSAMLSVIAVFDLTNEGRDIIADTFMTFEIWLTVAAIYLAVTVTLSASVSVLERSLRVVR